MTKPEMQAVINELQARLARAAIQCHYCNYIFLPGDPAQAEHWRMCPAHPARAELHRLKSDLEKLRLELRAVALELSRCRAGKAEPAAEAVTVVRRADAPVTMPGWVVGR